MTAPLTDTELAELQEKAERATRAPWIAFHSDVRTADHSLNEHFVLEYARPTDTAHIAAFNPQTALRLLSDLAHEREARREGERLLRGVWNDPSRQMPASLFDETRAFLASASPSAGGNEKPNEDERNLGKVWLWPDEGAVATPPPASSSGQAPIPSEAAVEAAAKELDDYIDLTPTSRKLIARALLRVGNAIDHPAGEVAQGWQIVPVEPTPAMIITGFQPLSDLYAKGATTGMEIRQVSIDSYRAMLSSAPQPPKSNPEGK